MEYLENSNLDEVIEFWARREDRTIPQLRYLRNPLLCEIPLNTQWIKVQLEREDLNSLRVINESAGWNILSEAGSLDTLTLNLRQFSTEPPIMPFGLMPDGRTWQQYIDDLIDGLQQFIANVGNQGLELGLILISSSYEGPFTILEGNHTAVGLYFEYVLEHPDRDYPQHYAYLGISPLMTSCQWYHP